MNLELMDFIKDVLTSSGLLFFHFKMEFGLLFVLGYFLGYRFYRLWRCLFFAVASWFAAWLIGDIIGVGNFFLDIGTPPWVLGMNAFIVAGVSGAVGRIVFVLHHKHRS